MQLGVIDYGGGNLRSLVRALEYLGIKSKVIDSPENIKGVTHLAYPGQGTFKDCMDRLHARGLVPPLKEWLKAKRPYFGICIGYQLLFEGSEESSGTPGLGILKGTVKKFSTAPELKIPHMGWNSAQPVNPNQGIWKGLGEDPYFYFVHSYYPEPVDKQIVSSYTTYGSSFASSIEDGNIFAAQFHPEKSQDAGLKLLQNFLDKTN